MTEMRLLDELRRWTQVDDTWWSLAVQVDDETRGVHLAVMAEPYLTYLLQGRKTIESRFSKNRIPPYGRIAAGDIVLLKKTAGPVVASFIAAQVTFLSPMPDSYERLRLRYGKAICADKAFWDACREKRFATLVGVNHVQKHNPRSIEKSDRRGWLVLREHKQDTSSKAA